MNMNGASGKTPRPFESLHGGVTVPVKDGGSSHLHEAPLGSLCILLTFDHPGSSSLHITPLYIKVLLSKHRARHQRRKPTGPRHHRVHIPPSLPGPSNLDSTTTFMQATPTQELQNFIVLSGLDEPEREQEMLNCVMPGSGWLSALVHVRRRRSHNENEKNKTNATRHDHRHK